jgi:opacity protein-like surface antigen
MKRWLPYVLLIMFSQSAQAQVFHGGILLGLTASQVDGDSYAGYDRLGILGGVYVSTELTHYLDARLEIRYASRGARNPASEDNTGSYLLSLHYIDIPVMGALKIKNYGSFELGLVPGYMFAANGEDDAGTLPEEYLVDFHKFDLGLLLGANIRITPKVTVSVRYTYSIFSIRDLESAGAYYSWFGKIFGNSRGDFNNYLSLGLNYQLR